MAGRPRSRIGVRGPGNGREPGQNQEIEGVPTLAVRAAAALCGTLTRGAERERTRTMPNPKRRHSTRRTALRRSHDFLTATGTSECPSCHEKKLPHQACGKCGVYKGRQVLDVKEAAK